MTTKEMAYQYRLSQWPELTKAHGALGLSIRVYCARKGFAESTYFCWQRRLRKMARTHLSSEQASLAGPCFYQSGTVPSTRDAGNTGAGRLASGEIKGSHLSVDSSYPPEKLAVLLRELSASC